MILLCIPSKQELMKVYLVFNASETVQGQSQFVHPGLVSTLIDNAFGYLSIAGSHTLSPAVTAYLSLNFKK